jgi:excisionase family DNA binding protein
MAVEILGMAEAARRLGVTTRDVVQMVYDRRIAYVLVDGILRIPDDAVEEYRRQAS